MAIRKTITLKDYVGDKKEFDITLSSRDDSNLTIIYTIQSGDEVVYIYQFNNLIYTLDPSDCRGASYLDTIKIMTLDELYKLNKGATE